MKVENAKVDNATAEGQRTLDTFVRQEVHYSVNELILELSKDDKYTDEILEFSGKPNPEEGYEDDYIEALEFWIVSDWFAKKLADKGELITLDFLGLTIWGRTCSGQSISMDCVISDIYNEFRG